MKTFFLTGILLPFSLFINEIQKSVQPLNVETKLEQKEASLCAPRFFFSNISGYVVTKIVVSCGTNSTTYNNPTFPFNDYGSCPSGNYSIRFFFQNTSGTGTIYVTSYSTPITSEDFDVRYFTAVSFNADCFSDYQIQITN